MEQYKYKINDNLYNITVNDIEDNIANAGVNGISYKVGLDTPIKIAPKPVTRSTAAPKTKSGIPMVTKQPIASKGDGMKSLLPGVILDIKVKAGDTAEKSQTIIILETMKMENNINANKDEEVAGIKVDREDSVLEGIDLVIIEQLWEASHHS